MLSNNFLDRVRSECTVDTKKYRYACFGEEGITLRKPLAELDTTSEWQLVAHYRLGGWER